MKSKINITFVGILLLAIVIVYGGLNGWFSNTSISQEVIERLENQQQGSCSAIISPTTVTIGDSVTGTIYASQNDVCEIYATDGTTWRRIAEVNVGSSGVATFTNPINIVGTFTFRALCGGDCITNSVTLNVNPLSSGNCIDSDGDNRDVPGHVNGEDGLVYYDKCLSIGQGVTEYICLNNKVTSKDWACDYGEVCVETRSGGYCVPSTPSLQPGDVVGTGSAIFNNLAPSSSNIFEINLNTEPGDNPICAEIEVAASLAVSACIPGYPTAKFEFYDSLSKRWEKSQAVDFSTYGNPAVVPVSWNGQTPFKMIVSNAGFCNINTNANVRIVVC